MRTGRFAMRAAALCAVCLALQSTAWAGSFQVNPIRVDLGANAQTAALKVKNTGDEPVVVQVSVEAWAQDDGKEVYSSTRDLLATPPVTTIPPDEERVVRIGLRRTPEATRELSYRLFLQEVPPPPKPGFQGLVVALRVGLPIFVAPTRGKASPQLAWKAARLPDQKLQLTAINSGTGHVQVAEINVMPDGGEKAIATQAGLSYVLPDQRRSWVLPLNSSLGVSRIRVKAVTDAGNLDTVIDLAD